MNAVVQTVILSEPRGETEIKEHVPKCVKEYIKDQPKKMSNATSNAIKRSSISEHLVKNPGSWNTYNDRGLKY